MGTIVVIFLGSCRVLVYVFFFKLVWLGDFQTVIIHITNPSNSKNLAGKQPNYFVWTFTNIKFLVKQTLVGITPLCSLQTFLYIIYSISKDKTQSLEVNLYIYSNSISFVLSLTDIKLFKHSQTLRQKSHKMLNEVMFQIIKSYMYLVEL